MIEILPTFSFHSTFTQTDRYALNELPNAVSYVDKLTAAERKGKK
jgi:hypothetical protein